MIEINKERLIEQLKKDEGFRPKAYWDIKQWSYGHGLCAPNKDATITVEESSKRIAKKVEECIEDFYKIFKGHEHKFNDIRAEAFVNLIYNMGPGVKGKPKLGGLQSFQNTLGHIFDYDEVDWGGVAYNLTQSLWYHQVGRRATRIVKEIEFGEKETKGK